MENIITFSPYLRPKEAARYLRIGLSSFWLKVKAKEIMTRKLGQRTTIVEISELEKYVNSLSNKESA